MAWTGFGGQWNDGVHSGGDDSGSIGGGGIKLDGAGNPVGTRSPTASDIANQFNSFGGTQITPGMVSNIRPDGEGGYTADVKGADHAVSVDGNTKNSTTLGGFTGVSTPRTNNGKGQDGGMDNWNDVTNSVRAGKIPKNFKLENGKVGIMTPRYRRISLGHGETYEQYMGDKFVEVPALTNAYNEGIKERDDYKNAVKMTADFYKEVGQKGSAQQAAIAKELAAAAKGKALHNVDQAMAAFTRNQAILDASLTVSSRESISHALQAVSRAQAAKNLKYLGKAAGVVSASMDLYDLSTELQKSIKTGNYRPFFVKATALLASYEAGLAVAWAFGIMLGAPLGIIGYAVIMAAVSALIDDKLVEKAIKSIQ